MREPKRDIAGELTPREVEMLRMLGSMPDTTPTVLAAAIGMPCSSMSNSIRRLLARGLISRKHGPNDNRKALLRRLAAGDHWLQRLDGTRRGFKASAMSADAR